MYRWNSHNHLDPPYSPEPHLTQQERIELIKEKITLFPKDATDISGTGWVSLAPLEIETLPEWTKENTLIHRPAVGKGEFDIKTVMGPKRVIRGVGTYALEDNTLLITIPLQGLEDEESGRLLVVNGDIEVPANGLYLNTHGEDALVTTLASSIDLAANNL